MSDLADEPCWLTGERSDAALAAARFLGEFSGLDRAQAIHLVLQQLRARVEPDQVSTRRDIVAAKGARVHSKPR